MLNCADCGININPCDGIKEYYMIWQNLWNKVAKNNEILCIGCLENRLGRKLIKSDFTECPINDGIFEQSDRLKNRLGKFI